MSQKSKSEYTLKVISRRRSPFIKGYENFMSIGDEAIIGNGILIHKSTEILWLRRWNHSYLKMFLHKKRKILIMDRLAMIGPVTLSAGICAVDYETGKYLWKHWHTFELFERIGFLKKSKSIKFENLDQVAFTDKHIYTCNFKVDLVSGRYYLKDEFYAKEIYNCVVPQNIKILRQEISPKAKILEIEDNNLSLFFIGSNGLTYYINETAGIIYLVAKNSLVETFYLNKPFEKVLAFDFFSRGILLCGISNMENIILIICN